MNRTQRILRFVAASKKPVTLPQVAAAVADGDTSPRYQVRIAATLCALHQCGKLERTGAPRAYRYTATARALVDGRKIDASGKPRNKSTQPRPRATRGLGKPKPATPAAAKAPRQVMDNQRFVITRGGARALRPAGERETVAEFLKRGGRIQKLKPGESSSPLFESVRELNAKTMRQRLAVADNDPDTDLDDVADIAAIANA